MYILVSAKGDLSLQDSDNMRAFAIVLQVSDASVTRLAEIGSTAEDDANYWLDAGAVEEFSGRKHDQQWLQNFRAMLVSAAPYGFYDGASNRVKAHVEPFDA
jgi:hypothetical protein